MRRVKRNGSPTHPPPRCPSAASAGAVQSMAANPSCRRAQVRLRTCTAFQSGERKKFGMGVTGRQQPIVGSGGGVIIAGAAGWWGRLVLPEPRPPGQSSADARPRFCKPAAVLSPVASLQASTARWRATTTIGFFRAAPLARAVRVGSSVRRHFAHLILQRGDRNRFCSPGTHPFPYS